MFNSKLLILPEGKTPGEPTHESPAAAWALAEPSRSLLPCGWSPNLTAVGGSGSAGDVFIRDFSRENGKNPLVVGGWPTILKNMKVNGKDYPIYYGK